LEYVLALIVLLALVAIVVIRPLTRDVSQDEQRYDARRAQLEAAKEAKYREIRDAELDHQMGKLSDEDYKAVDRELRAEAIAILRDLDSLD
jgi:type II secretory pathway component PulM